MPRISLNLTRHEYNIGTGLPPIIAYRPCIRLEWTMSQFLRPTCFIDSGAPISIVSYSVARMIPYRRVKISNDPIPMQDHLGNASFVSRVGFEFWEGLPAELGEIDTSVFDSQSQMRYGPYRLLAKFVKQPSPFYNDLFVILGMSFLAENNGKLEISGSPWNMTGSLELP